MQNRVTMLTEAHAQEASTQLACSLPIEALQTIGRVEFVRSQTVRCAYPPTPRREAGNSWAAGVPRELQTAADTCSLNERLYVQCVAGMAAPEPMVATSLAFVAVFMSIDRYIHQEQIYIYTHTIICVFSVYTYI